MATSFSSYAMLNSGNSPDSHPEDHDLFEIASWDSNIPSLTPDTFRVPEADCRFKVSPSDPLDEFPVVMFSTAFDTANRVSLKCFADEQGMLNCSDLSNQLQYCLVLKLVFDLNNPQPVQERSYANIALLQLDDGTSRYVVETSNGLIIDPWMDCKANLADLQHVFVGSAKEYLEHVPHQNLNVEGDSLTSQELEHLRTVSRQIVWNIQERLTHGEPAVLFSACHERLREPALLIMQALINSPYNHELEMRPKESGGTERSRGSGRFAVIDKLHSLRTDNPQDHSEQEEVDKGTDELLDFLRSKPRALVLRGWCGGTMLHEAAEYGNAKLLEGLIGIARERAENNQLRDVVSRETLSLEELLNRQNRDGSTALELARRHGNQACCIVSASPAALRRNFLA